MPVQWCAGLALGLALAAAAPSAGPPRQAKFELAFVDELSGEPLENVTVLCLHAREKRRVAKGVFVVTSLSGSPALSLEADAPGYVALRTELHPSRGASQAFTFRLARLVPLQGVVRDSEGAPLAEARVEIRRGLEFSTALTEKDGTFKLEARGAGSWTLRAFKSGYRKESREVRVPEEAPLALVLEPLKLAVVVQVVDRAGQPVGDAEVSFVDTAARDGPLLRTGKDGLVRFFTADPGTLGVTATARGYLWTSAEVAVPRAEPLRLALPDPESFRGRVVDEAGAPVAGLTLDCGEEAVASTTDSEGAFAVRSSSNTCRCTAHLDGAEGSGYCVHPEKGPEITLRKAAPPTAPSRATGRLVLQGKPVRNFQVGRESFASSQGRFTVELRPGTNSLNFSGDFAPRSLQVEGVPGTTLELGEVRVQPAGALAIEVQAPAPGDLTLFAPYRPGSQVVRHRARLMIPGPGSYRFNTLGETTYLLFGGGKGWAIEPTRAKVGLGRTTALKAKVVPGAPLGIHCIGDSPLELDRGEERYQILTGPDGDLPGLPEGRWFVTGDFCPRRVVDLVAGEGLVLEDRPELAVVEVQLTAPGPGVLELRTGGYASESKVEAKVEVAGTGSWRLSRLYEVPYRLTGWGEGWALEPVEVTPAVGRPLAVEARAVPGARVRVTCDGQDEYPPDPPPLHVSRGQQTFRVEHPYRFAEVGGLPAGTWTFSNMACPDATVEVVPGPPTDLRFKVPKAGGGGANEPP